jgi:glycosyl transferase family 87
MSLTGERRERRLNPLLFALAVIGLLAGVGWVVTGLGNDVLSDVHAYYDAATRLNAGRPLYDQAATTNESAFYRYPPLLAIAFRPLALLPFPLAGAIWEGVVVASLVGLVVVLRPDRTGWAAAAILALPIVWSVDIGQAQVPVTLLLAIGSPWSIALAAHLKVLPALAAIWWLGRRDWRSLGRFAAWLVGLGVIQLALEPAGTLAFPSVLSLDTVGEVRNWSPYAISPWLWASLALVGVAAAWRLAPTRWGWAAAVTLSVLATPRLLLYQLMTLVAGLREPAPASHMSAPAPAIAPAVRPAPRP